MNIILSIIIASFFIHSQKCLSLDKPEYVIQDTTSITTQTDSVESFKTFYTFFFSNFNNQISRVKFPLKYISSFETGDPMNGIEYLSKSKWTFFDLKKANWRGKLLSKSRLERLVNFQVVDTGEYINCKFKLIQGKWYLVEVFDGSM